MSANGFHVSAPRTVPRDERRRLAPGWKWATNIRWPAQVEGVAMIDGYRAVYGDAHVAPGDAAPVHPDMMGVYVYEEDS